MTIKLNLQGFRELAPGGLESWDDFGMVHVEQVDRLQAMLRRPSLGLAFPSSPLSEVADCPQAPKISLLKAIQGFCEVSLLLSTPTDQNATVSETARIF